MFNALHGAPWLGAMARVFDCAGAPLYVVGGGVRNPLMGLPISDVDVCGPLLPHEICALCEGAAVRARIRAANFGTVELYVGRHMAEYTAWREDSYQSGHKPDHVAFTADIRADARRRDFSCNALYQRVHDGWMEDVIDPTGGLRHMRMGVLHTTTRDPDAILANDGQRILRAARFQAEMDLAPTRSMMDSLRRNAHLVREISLERLRDETENILMADLRYPTLRRRRAATASGLETIAAIGIWEDLFPGVSYDQAAALALRNLRGTLPERMALLLHASAPDTVEKAMQRMRFTVKDTAKAVACVTAMHSLDAELPALAKLGMDALEAARRMHRALGWDASKADKAVEALRGRPLSVKELAVSGNDLKPLLEANGRPLREMGQVLDGLWRLVLSGETENAPNALLEQAQRLVQARSLNAD